MSQIVVLNIKDITKEIDREKNQNKEAIVIVIINHVISHANNLVISLIMHLKYCQILVINNFFQIIVILKIIIFR